ncbi:MAG: glycosyl transferase family 1 [Desulfobacterales bacterium C00003106]|jgi:glycosyltransferase involved in cell wall biosynthesis|nr:MAG: glycosyl transferase family 1 [Desulfobacterales bacterium C00003106]OEU81831.1 MAG: glycosyl transferase family 1 [Desulfobulbaceae bacterium C00003063]
MIQSFPSFRNAGFISTRIAGTDGVSLEIEKWAAVLERNNYNCFYLSGENDRESERCMLVDQMHFSHPEIQEINAACYAHEVRPNAITGRIHRMRNYLKQRIYEFVDRFDIDFIIPENALAIPLNIPLGLALTEFIAETGFPTVAHHHDFSWERTRFLVNAVGDYLSWAFPPNLPTIQHAVINTLASQQLCHRKGISNTVIPNVYDFASPPPPCGRHLNELRRELGMTQNDFFILQPTRVVPRKWIERSLEIVSLMELRNPLLVLSHSAEDEGDSYNKRIQEYARNLNVKLVSIEHLIGQNATAEANGRKRFSIGDVYRCADLVCYPSGYEGFGNAFLEAIYYRKPTVVNRYSIYIADIEPKNFDAITIEGFVTRDTTARILEVLTNDEQREKMVERNYQLAGRHFSFEVLERLLLHLVHTLEIQHGR